MALFISDEVKHAMLDIMWREAENDLVVEGRNAQDQPVTSTEDVSSTAASNGTKDIDGDITLTVNTDSTIATFVFYVPLTNLEWRVTVTPDYYEFGGQAVITTAETTLADES